MSTLTVEFVKDGNVLERWPDQLAAPLPGEIVQLDKTVITVESRFWKRYAYEGTTIVECYVK